MKGGVRMYLTVKQKVKHLSKDEYKSIKKLSHIAKNLTNEAIYKTEEKILKIVVVIGSIFILTFLILSFCFYYDEIKKLNLMLLIIIFISITSVLLYFSFLNCFISIMLKNDKEYKTAVEILKDYKKHCKEEKVKEKQFEEKEYIDKINKLEEYAKNLKKYKRK